MSIIAAFPTEKALARLQETIKAHEHSVNLAKIAMLDQWANQPKETRIAARDMVEDLQKIQTEADKVQAALMRAHNQLAKL